MKRLSCVLLVGLFTLALFTAGTAEAQGVTLDFDAERSQIKITGTSTIHDWTCADVPMNGSIGLPGFELDSAALPVDALRNYLTADKQDTPSASLAIPVKSIGCEKSGMNSRTHDALKAKKHPEISYEMTSVDVANFDTELSRLNLNTTGILTVAGTPQTIQMSVVVEKTEQGMLRIKGKKDLTMSQFKVERPSAMFGTIQAYNDIAVHYTIYATPQRPEGGE